MSLATTNVGGGAYLSGVAYLHKNTPTVYFMAKDNTQIVKNLYHQPIVAYTIWDPVEDMKNLKALQMLGKARLLKDEERHKALKLFSKLPADIDTYVSVQIKPNLVRWTDNNIGFGYGEIVKY